MFTIPYFELLANPKIDVKLIQHIKVGEVFRYNSFWFEKFSPRFAYPMGISLFAPQAKLLMLSSLNDKFGVVIRRKP